MTSPQTIEPTKWKTGAVAGDNERWLNEDDTDSSDELMRSWGPTGCFLFFPIAGRVTSPSLDFNIATPLISRPEGELRVIYLPTVGNTELDLNTGGAILVVFCFFSTSKPLGSMSREGSRILTHRHGERWIPRSSDTHYLN